MHVLQTDCRRRRRYHHRHHRHHHQPPLTPPPANTTITNTNTTALQVASGDGPVLQETEMVSVVPGRRNYMLYDTIGGTRK